MISTRRLAGVDRADARASSVARRAAGFFGETAALRVAGFLAGFGAGDAGFFGDAAARFGLGDAAAGLAAGFAAGFLGELGLRLRGSGVAERFGWTRVGFGDLGAAFLAALAVCARVRRVAGMFVTARVSMTRLLSVRVPR